MPASVAGSIVTAKPTVGIFAKLPHH
jgi:hypothetical protein